MTTTAHIPAPTSAAATASANATPAAQPVATPKQTLTMLLDLGRAMLTCGADVNLVESWLSRLGHAYGATSMNVFVITSSIVVTMQLPTGESLTETRRITSASSDFTKLEALNSLCRECESNPVDPRLMADRIRDLDQKTMPRLYLYLGGFLASGGFAIFFGGSPVDGLVSGLFGLVICLMMDFLRPYVPNTIAFNFVASLMPGLGIAALCAAIPSLQLTPIMVGDVMILIPGIAITNALRDMLAGDTIAGILRLAESLLWAGAMALGFMVAMALVGVAA